MQLTRLKLVGFKSFVDPTDLLIEPGLTGVVGPNGCGKSNLVEALRWVMGESSYKSLRGSGMDDVIFSGSGNRPSRNIAEVTLSIDNSERSAPAAFNAFDQLDVSRKIERESGSNYRVNGKDVRARDVTLLFADAATGARSSALVRQGQIGELIAAKPQARRRILEDAAGIAGLHSRRHEAELRLRAAETNLERLDDVMGQIQSQLDSLKRQARHAIKFKQLSAEIRRLEAIAAHLRFTAAAEAAKLTLQERDELTRRVAERTQAVATANKENAVASAQLPELREAEAEAAAKLVALTTARDGLDLELERIQTRNAELDGILAQVAEDLRREQALDAETAPILERLDAEATELRSVEESMAEARATAEASRVTAHEKLTKAEAALSERLNALAQVRAERGQLERLVREEAERRDRLATQRDAAERERRTLEPNPEEAARRQALTRDEAEKQESLNKAEAEIPDRETALENARLKSQEHRDALQSAEQAVAALAAETRTLESVLAATDSADGTPVVAAMDVDPGFETALGAVLGDDLNYPVDPAAAIHWSGIEAGPNDPSLPSGTTPLSEYVRAPAALARRLKQTGIVAPEEAPKLAKSLAPGQRIVTRDGAVWRWDGLTARADAPTPAAQRLAQRNRLTALVVELAEQEAKIAPYRFAYHEAQNLEATARMALDDARARLKECRRAHQSAQELLRNDERQLSKTVARRSALDEAIARLSASVLECRTNQDAATARLNELGSAAVLEATLAGARGDVDAARNDLSAAQAETDGLEREAQQRANRLRAIGEERAAWARRVASAADQIERLTNRQTAARAEKETLDGKPGEITEQRRSLAGKLEAAEIARKDAADRLAEVETLQRDQDAAERAAQKALSEAREALAACEARVEATDARLVELSSGIEAALDVSPDHVLKAAGITEDEPLPPMERVERELETLKRDRERLGGVNLRAEEEAAEVQSQLEGMTSEREDLEQAIRRLRQAIGNLNKEGRERLLRAFDIVNGHFKRLFSTLFGGGTAEMQLTESDDPLEAGLEIIAKPPGKKTQTLTLLSGGEQALTATALIFAVFLTNPSPICVLDEVDAPLDDANVGRYCDLLDEIKAQTETRFIVITHNPVTMARMDRLFGVTMAERGVSQLVSVDLETAEQFLEAV